MSQDPNHMGGNKVTHNLYTTEQLEAQKGRYVQAYTEFLEDFYCDGTVSTSPHGMVATKTGTSGNNTITGASAAGGVLRLTHSGDSEAQTMRVDAGDSLWVNLSKKPVFEARLKLNLAGAALSADQRLVAGLGSAYNGTLNSVTTNAWFRIEGATLDVYWESDDGSTDDDDNDTGVNFVDDTYLLLKIDFYDLSAVKFYIDGQKVGTADMSGLSANTLVQPMVAIQRDAGTEADVLDIDYIQVTQART